MASVRSCENLLLCPIEPMPARSKKIPPLEKAELISDGGSTSVIIESQNHRKLGWKRPLEVI